jgi:hypothetical protein
MEWELAGETEVLWENKPQRHFDHHKSHITWSGKEPRTLQSYSLDLIAQYNEGVKIKYNLY